MRAILTSLLILISCGETNFLQQETSFRETQEVQASEYRFKPELLQETFEHAEVTFILDDSTSMNQEIDTVKNALINLSSTMVNSGLRLTLKFVKMSEINTNRALISNLSNDETKYYRNMLPGEFAVISINQSSNPIALERRVQSVLGNFSTRSNFANEEGLCLTLHHLDSLKQTALNPKTRYIAVVLSDEDEYNRDSSANCYYQIKEDRRFLGTSTEYATFQGKNGGKTFIDSFDKVFDEIPWLQSGSYSWLGIFFDQNQSLCSPQGTNNVDGRYYKEFLNYLKQKGIPNGKADICQLDYSNIFEEKLIRETLQLRKFEYPIKTQNIDIDLLSVHALYSTGLEEIPSSLFELLKRNDKYFISFSSSDRVKKILDEAQEIILNFK